MTLLMLAHLAATIAMVGLIWFVQIVHYPLMAAVGVHGFATYHAWHGRRTALVVVPLMLIELVTGVWLVLRPGAISTGLVWAGLGLLFIVWLSTATLQVPQHRVLARGFDESVHRRLVRTNWVRTAGWTARGVLVLFIASTVWL